MSSVSRDVPRYLRDKWIDHAATTFGPEYESLFRVGPTLTISGDSHGSAAPKITPFSWEPNPTRPQWAKSWRAILINAVYAVHPAIKLAACHEDYAINRRQYNEFADANIAQFASSDLKRRFADIRALGNQLYQGANNRDPECGVLYQTEFERFLQDKMTLEERAKYMIDIGHDLDLPYRFTGPWAPLAKYFNRHIGWRPTRFDPHRKWRHGPALIMKLYPPEWYEGTVYFNACEEYAKCLRNPFQDRLTPPFAVSSHIVKRILVYGVELVLAGTVLWLLYAHFLHRDLHQIAAILRWVIHNGLILIPLAI